jgi:ubiquitin-protein ligase
MDDTGTLRSRRLSQEWKLLAEIQRINPEVVEIRGRRAQADCDLFAITLHHTTGILAWSAGHAQLAGSHAAVFRFPRFFPSVPIEASLSKPLFHPNIDPQNGFVCLWTRFSSGDTVMEAVRRLQQIIAWKLVNLEAPHVMQPEAARWYRESAPPAMLPLAFTPLVESHRFRLEKSFSARGPDGFRRRLEPVSPR